MGPAIREGYWQPEDEYAKYGERHNNNLILSSAAEFNNNLACIGWDTTLFDGEQKISYEVGANTNVEYYPFIDLTSHLADFILYKDNLGQISFIYQDISAPADSSDNLLYLHFLPIGSQSQLVFLNSENNGVFPALLLTGLQNVNINNIQNCRIGILTTTINGSTISSNITTLISVPNNNIIKPNDNTYSIIYPRIRINSSDLKNSEDKLIIKIENQILSNYEDYYVLGREDIENAGTANEVSHFRNYITFKPELIFKLGTYPTFNIHYELANTGLMMYLDAKQVLRENAYPKVSYSIKPTLMDENFTRTAYKYLNRITHINDYELKFENVQGYISELHLMLDSPKDDDIKIENYKTKFEDLFSSIVVQTEEMKKNSAIIGMTASAFTNAGELKGDVVQSVMNRVDLNYAFNNGALTIDEAEGIWGTSDSGVVAFRGGGIFTATEKDDNDNWIWNTGILPSGINASLITTGQLDTNLIRVFAGDDLKFQLNGDGLFAYRSWWNNNNGTTAENPRNDGLDLGQYVVHNSDGLFLHAEKGTNIPFDFARYNSNITIAQVQLSNIDDAITLYNTLLVAYKAENNYYEYNNDLQNWGSLANTGIIQFINYIIKFFSDNFKNKNVVYWFVDGTDNTIESRIETNIQNNSWQDYNILIDYHNKTITVYSYNDGSIVSENVSSEPLTENVDRVAISWDGLTLRNWNNDKVFYADANTGNLTVEGTIRAKELIIIDTNNNITNIDTYINNFINFDINGSANATVAINPIDGIKVTDNTNNYFQVTATQMGFWKYISANNYEQKLGFTNGNLFISGEIIANSGKIGYDNSNVNSGWTIGTNSLYSGSASSFDANNGIYLGTGGLSVSGNDYKVHFNTSEFLVNIGNENAGIRIDGDGAVMENLTVTGKFIADNNGIYNGPDFFIVGDSNSISSYSEYDTYENLQEVLDILKNKIITKSIQIELVSNIYGYFNLEGMSGSGDITITSRISQQILYGGLWINNCQLNFSLNDVKIIYGNENNQFPIRIDRSNIIRVSNVDIDGGASDNCIIINNSLVRLNNCILYNSNELIYVANNSFLQCKNLDGDSLNGRYLDCSYSAIVWSGTRPQGTFIEIDPCLIKCETATGYSSDLDNLSTTGNIPPQPIPTIVTTTHFTPLSENGTGCFGNTNWNNGINPRQGAYGSVLYKGCIWFNLSILAGKTLLNASLTLTRLNGAGGSSPVDVYLYTTPATSTSSENPVNNSTYINMIGTIGSGETKTFTIPTSAVSALFDSAGNRIGGLMLYHDESSGSRTYSSNYSKFDTNIILTVTYQ